MKKNFILSFLLVIFSLILSGQSTEWVMSHGDFQSEKGISIGTDSLGFIYISGFFNNDITFGSTTLFASSFSTSNKDMFIAKMDSSGNYIWAISGGGGPFDDRALGMHVTPGGQVYLTGTFWGNISFNGTSGPVTANGNGHDTSLMAKFDTNGNCIWARGFGASPSGSCPWPIYDGDDHSYDVEVDEDDNIYVTGFFSGNSADFDAFTLNNPNWTSCQPSGYIGKMDSNGAFLWAQKFDGIKDQRGSRDNRIGLDNLNNVYVIGGFENTGVYGPFSLVSNGEWDAFLFKMDTDGNFLWAKNVGSNKSDRGNGIAIDYADNVYISGEYRNPMVFSGANASNGTDTLSHKQKRDVFVAKITTNGDWVWAKRARSAGVDKPYQMSVDNNMQVFVAGSAGDSLKFNDNIILTNGDTSINAFVAQIDGSDDGDWIWAKMGGGTTDNDRAGDITEDGGDNVYSVGFYESTANFDGISHTSLGKKDVFVWKLKKDQTVDITPSNTVYIEVQPPGSGTVNLTGTGTILTSSLNIPHFPSNQSLSDSVIQTFDAIPNTGYQLLNWDWQIHNPLPNATSPNTTVLTYTDDTLIVYFEEIVTDTITYIVQPPGSGTITVDATNITTFPSTQYYNQNTSSSLTATPNTGFSFSDWDFDNNTPNPSATSSNITVTWLSNDTCIINFSVTPSYNITYMTNPPGAGNLDIDAVNYTAFPTTQTYFQNTNVSLVANDNNNFLFRNWTTQSNTLAPSNNDDMVSFNVLGNDTIIANYNELDTLWVISEPEGVAIIEVGPDVITTTPYMGLYQLGSVIPITASVSGSNVFNQWNLNQNSIPDYNESTLFTFLKTDTLFVYFNNILAIEDLGNDIAEFNIYPNIVNNELTVEILPNTDSSIEMDLINISGQKIMDLYEGNLQEDVRFNKTFEIKATKGIYFIRVKSNNTNASFKIIKI